MIRSFGRSRVIGITFYRQDSVLENLNGINASRSLNSQRWAKSKTSSSLTLDLEQDFFFTPPSLTQYEIDCIQGFQEVDTNWSRINL